MLTSQSAATRDCKFAPWGPGEGGGGAHLATATLLLQLATHVNSQGLYFGSKVYLRFRDAVTKA